MTNPTIASRAEWLEARKALLEQEKAHTKQKDALAEARRNLPWVKIDKTYRFQTTEGEKTLGQLFGPRSQLITYHFMFGPEWENPCKSCSFWADSYNGLSPHLGARDVAFVAVSSAPLERLTAFKDRMGWDFEWVSSFGSDFNFDYDVGFGPDRPKEMSRAYNFGTIADAPIDEMHGTSVFAKGDDGSVFHTYSMYGRGLDTTNAAYSYIDLTPKGRSEPAEGNPMAWLEYHDAY
ncbi:Predicted dithiol-disulfide oxidoreductase, DUF899 family [Aliiroseovarius halocynthiae]|uniref:DUF899 domain-containing protein n=1 Tax=Aliiroseovarius halocynthiae TaxID=985055 RepID=A0A545SQX4_9RHOB|nr:DUF899 domain-containing protein [Aliiroseovarius halocynthiae]TQV67354.1 DUF899 domain-containing protein [Aliiroseovarius halocynthiae]SMR81245.1 Predicted dithiol-disulfide oxidoreductase, DUF899 family [Aliiroseovarius halocynthiae]